MFLKPLFSLYREKLIISREIDWTPSEVLRHFPAGDQEFKISRRTFYGSLFESVMLKHVF